MLVEIYFEIDEFVMGNKVKAGSKEAITGEDENSR
jgi:hypothetical protein